MKKPGKIILRYLLPGVMTGAVILSAGCSGGAGVPPAPSGLSAAASSAAQINLSWTDNSADEDGFKIERKAGPEETYSLIGMAGGNSTAYSDTGLSCETTYYYQVRSYNRAGDSDYSEAASATTLACPLAVPEAPSQLTAAAVSSSEIDIFWRDESLREDGFRIERKTGPGGAYSEAGTAWVNATVYHDAGLSCGAEYYYRVRSYNAAGNSDYSGETYASAGACPAAPTDLQAAAFSAGRIDLGWADNSTEESGFRVERKRGAGGIYFPVHTSSANETSWSDSGLGGGEVYSYRVSAFCPGGVSAYSNEASASTPAGAMPPAGMASVPGDCCRMGDALGVGLANEGPAHPVCVSAFLMDIYEVTNSRYYSCVNAGFCVRPGDTGSATGRSPYYGNPAYAGYPVIFVSWSQAKKFCEWAGGRLPTEAEWEFAARGGLADRKFPWGDETPVCTAGAASGVQFGSCPPPHDTGPVGSFPANGFGLYDLAGNVSEWIGDWYESGYYSSSPVFNPAGPGYATYRVLRGGSWFSLDSDLRVSRRDFEFPTDQNYSTGFRCVK